MKQWIKKYINVVTEKVANRIITGIAENGLLADNIAHRVAMEAILSTKTKDKKPNEIFSGISDDFWFWLNTEGCRRNMVLRNMLPGVPDEYTQQMFTGAKGDTTLWEANYYYKIFKDQFQKYKGPIAEVDNILDFGCGWGRIIRFFIKDVEPGKIWGCDPVEEMIQLCREQNKWCNFLHIHASPPTSFEDNKFDFIYSFSVFSHLSEDFHLSVLKEIDRILKPGGIYITTTRNREYIAFCAELRKRKDLDTMHPANSVSAQAFPDTEKSLSMYDKGLYSFHTYNDEKWPYWGEAAIPKKYVLDHWTQHFTLLDYLSDPQVLAQNIIIVQKPFDLA